MKIVLRPEVAMILEATVGLAGNQEFSGFGFANSIDGYIDVYDFILLDVGSMGFTEIKTEDVVRLSERPDAANIKVWVHKHMVGDGVPGPQNWSGTDNQTIAEDPLGGIPQLVGWSASIVRTPKGWVGRVDNHITKKTVHVEVLPAIPLALFQKVSELKIAYLRSIVSKITEKSKHDLVYQEGLFDYPSIDEEIVDDDEFILEDEDRDNEGWTDDDRWIDAGYEEAELPGWSYVGGRRGTYSHKRSIFG